nr:zinc finger, CCHC-type, retrotransposon Gag domain protein [Tanacetum cinerariifolium]
MKHLKFSFNSSGLSKEDFMLKDGQNLYKMKEKVDACVFLGYSTQSRAYKNALQAMLPRIHEEIREEFRTGSGSSNTGGNPPPVTIYTWLERFNKQKPHSFEKA